MSEKQLKNAFKLLLYYFAMYSQSIVLRNFVLI